MSGSQPNLLRRVFEIAAIWMVASGGYDIVLPHRLLVNTYDLYPLATVLYFGFWAAVTLFIFRDVIPDRLFGLSRVRAYAELAAFSGALLLFYIVLLPLLPDARLSSFIDWNLYINPGDPSFFFGKAMEILLQQVLVVALVRLLATVWHSTLAVSIAYAVCFGFAHLFMLLQGFPPSVVGEYLAAALLSALAFPYLILKTKNGFVYTYMLHWLFYVAIALVARL